MDPLMNSTNAAAHSSGAAGQPSVTDVAQLNKDEVMAAWDHLKLQVNRFNAIVSIHAGTFGTWSVADKNLIVHLMKQEVQQEDIHYAVDTNLTDRVYLSSTFHFAQAGIYLPHSHTQELPILTYNHNQLTGAMSNPMVDNTSFESPISYVNDTTGTSGVSKRKSKSKAPASGIRRPRNSWILYRSARQAQITREEGPIPNSMMSTRLSQEWKILGPAEKKRWKDLAQEEKREHARNNPHYKYQPRKPGGIKKRNARKAAAVSLVSSPAASRATLSVAGNNETTSGPDDDMTSDGNTGDIRMSSGEILANYAIYNNLTPVVGSDDPIGTQDKERANQSLVNFNHNPEAVLGREAPAFYESAYGTGINSAFENPDTDLDFGTLLGANLVPALSQDHQATASESLPESDFDIDSLFGDPVPDSSMTASDWMDAINRASFHSP
ncbi:hypothetical protein DL765_003691 [Monosporascus sp. GIB2]|nr:hypothetical protein DL765_003691 [Monosporascus sp. GIB2]